jgi:acyl-CoA synthetase (AMP-forming)/AMP-acid ligase II
MMHTHSLGRAARYYPERLALAPAGKRVTFRELHDRVAATAGALRRHGLGAGDRLALLLPNQPEYIELVYACSWLGVIAVPLNTRLSAPEIDRVLSDASPKGLIRHSSLPAPTVPPAWHLVLDQKPLDVRSDSYPEPIYDPDALLEVIYTSGTTRALCSSPPCGGRWVSRWRSPISSLSRDAMREKSASSGTPKVFTRGYHA